MSRQDMIEYTIYVIENKVQVIDFFRDRDIPISAARYVNLISILRNSYQQIKKIYKNDPAKLEQFTEALKESALTTKPEQFIDFPQSYVFSDFYSYFLKAIDILMPNFSEPIFIEGPVNFIYLKGDPGDGVIRKVLLLGDYHLKGIKCSEKNISVADFLRYIVHYMSPKIIDIFIESFYDDSGFFTSLPDSEAKDQYLSNLQFEFSECLKKSKKYCYEPMRIHYIDPRNLSRKIELFSLHLIQSLTDSLLEPHNFPAFGRKILEDVRWPEGDEIGQIAKQSVEDARLTDSKLLSIDSLIRQRFKDVIIFPILQKIIIFYEDNRELFEQVKNIKRITTVDERNKVKDLRYNIIILKSNLLDAYFIYRLLKRSTERKPSLPKLALKPGEPTTHVIGYMGLAHTLGVRDMLYKLGFDILGQEDINNIEVKLKNKNFHGNPIQCLSYTSIKPSIDDFSSREIDN